MSLSQPDTPPSCGRTIRLRNSQKYSHRCTESSSGRSIRQGETAVGGNVPRLALAKLVHRHRRRTRIVVTLVGRHGLRAFQMDDLAHVTHVKAFLAEADFFLENGEYAMPVEVKTELSVSDVNEHIERLAKIREYMDARNDKRKLVGAVAGEIVAENVLHYAQKKGLYVLKQSGDSVTIAAAPHNFKQQEW